MHMSSLIAADTRCVHYGAFVLKANKKYEHTAIIA